jgi:hypothetical protein
VNVWTNVIVALFRNWELEATGAVNKILVGDFKTDLDRRFPPRVGPIKQLQLKNGLIDLEAVFCIAIKSEHLIQ